MYNIKGTALDITPELREYVEKKLDNLDTMFAHDDAVRTDVELEFLRGEAQTYRAEFMLHAAHLAEPLRTEVTGRTLHEAIDGATSELVREAGRTKKKKIHVLRRGAAKVKEFLRGGK